STTPTDNAFTKSTGSTIDTVWNNTPYTTDTSADSGSTTAAVAQTMWVRSWQLTPTANESGIIYSSSTVNGCQIGVVASATTANSTVNVRFRLNGGGATDASATAVAGQTRYFQSGLFTDTVANLDLYEMGFTKATAVSNRSVTAMDVWMMCDVLNGLK